MNVMKFSASALALMALSATAAAAVTTHASMKGRRVAGRAPGAGMLPVIRRA